MVSRYGPFRRPAPRRNEENKSTLNDREEVFRKIKLFQEIVAQISGGAGS
jgi:hypothetical protein